MTEHESKQTYTPSLAELMGTLNELGAAARTGEGDRYRAALNLAERQGVTQDQIRDAYQWGRRGLGAAAAGFDWRGK